MQYCSRFVRTAAFYTRAFYRLLCGEVVVRKWWLKINASPAITSLLQQEEFVVCIVTRHTERTIDWALSLRIIQFLAKMLLVRRSRDLRTPSHRVVVPSSQKAPGVASSEGTRDLANLFFFNTPGLMLLAWNNNHIAPPNNQKLTLDYSIKLPVIANSCVTPSPSPHLCTIPKAGSSSVTAPSALEMAT